MEAVIVGRVFLPPTQPLGLGPRPGRQAGRQAGDRRSGEQVADRAHPEGVAPAAPAMLASVVAHMAPLAERSEVARSVVAGIVVQVRAGEHDARDPQRGVTTRK